MIFSNIFSGNLFWFYQLTRRTNFALVGLFAFFLASCATDSESPIANIDEDVTVSVSASANANPGPNGTPAPITVRVYALKSSGRFNSLDYFQLQENESAVLGGDILDSRRVSVRPGQSTTISLNTGGGQAQTIAVAAGFRSIDSAKWRATSSLSGTNKFVVRAGNSSVSISKR